MRLVAAATVLLWLLCPHTALAQRTPDAGEAAATGASWFSPSRNQGSTGGSAAAGAGSGVAIRGFGDVGLTRFAAGDSFDAVLGSATGAVVGGGIEADLARGIFIAARASRFRGDGERAFVYDGDVFPLGIDTTVTVTPVELTGGYRFRRDAAIAPYAGGGIGWHHYQERSALAADEENVDRWVTGYHLLGGAEVRLSPWLAVAGEAQWTTVPDGLGQDVSSVAAAFEEDDLGGTTIRIKIVIGGRSR